MSYTIWITGLPCAGKTTLGKRLKYELIKKGHSVVHLDGDDIRKGLNSDLGFSSEDRKENLRRISHIAELLNKNGNLVIASFVSPTNELRNMISGIIQNIKLVYARCSLDECEKRDVKGMYKKARNKEIEDFTGIDAPFEEPDTSILIDTEKKDVDYCINELILNLDKELI